MLILYHIIQLDQSACQTRVDIGKKLFKPFLFSYSYFCVCLFFILLVLNNN